MDNTMALVYLVNSGGADLNMTLIVKQIYALLNWIGACLYKVVWIKGSLNVEVDAALWWVDHNDWTMQARFLCLMHLQLGPWMIDCFADHINVQAPRFNSLFLVLGTEVQDAFSVLWVGEVNLLVPPFYLILWVLQHLVECWVIGMIVVPWWEAQLWWPILLWVTTRVVVLGHGLEVVVPGPSDKCELNTMVSLHSLHIGGATAAMMGGLQCKQIMAISGWCSGVVNRYLHTVETAKVGASTLILGSGL